jgi:hypothetical protein
MGLAIGSKKGKGSQPLFSGHFNQGLFTGRHRLNPSAALKVPSRQQFHLRTKRGFPSFIHKAPYLLLARKARISGCENYRQHTCAMMITR